MARILLVEDEVALADTLQRFFKHEEHKVEWARSRSEALQVSASMPVDVALLDVMLNEGPEPEHDGFQVCKALRDAGYSRPVMFLTARTSEADKLLGFELGADDYVTKPFSMHELHARIKAVLKRAGGARSVYRYGDVEIDFDDNVVRHADAEESLSIREQELLRYLLEHPNEVLPREKLLTEVWKYSPNVTTRTVDTHILNLRKKLRDDAANPRFIETRHGRGYRFVGVEG